MNNRWSSAVRFFFKGGSEKVRNEIDENFERNIGILGIEEAWSYLSEQNFREKRYSQNCSSKEHFELFLESGFFGLKFKRFCVLGQGSQIEFLRIRVQTDILGRKFFEKIFKISIFRVEVEQKHWLEFSKLTSTCPDKHFVEKIFLKVYISLLSNSKQKISGGSS